MQEVLDAICIKNQVLMMVKVVVVMVMTLAVLQEVGYVERAVESWRSCPGSGGRHM